MGIFRNKNTERYFMFKNKARRQSFRTLDLISGVFYIIAQLALTVCIVILMFNIFYVMLFFFLVTPESLIISRINTLFQIIFYVAVVFSVFYGVKFVFEWILIRRETAELKQNPEENKNYLAVSRVVKKAKLLSLASAILFFSAVSIMYLLPNDIYSSSAIYWLLLLPPLAALIVSRIITQREFLRLSQPIKEIIEAEKIKKTP